MLSVFESTAFTGHLSEAETKSSTKVMTASMLSVPRTWELSKGVLSSEL